MESLAVIDLTLSAPRIAIGRAHHEWLLVLVSAAGETVRGRRDRWSEHMMNAIDPRNSRVGMNTW